MMRLTAALVVLPGLVTAAPAATVASRREPPAARNEIPAALVSQVVAGEEKPQYRMTEDTQVLLDGKACPYEKVPEDASVILLEVNADRVILKIHFQSKK